MRCAEPENGARLDDPRRARESQILEAAVALFSARGYAATSVDEIARAVGLRRSSLYHYIATKADLLAWLGEHLQDGAEQIETTVTRRVDLSPLRRLDLYVQSSVAYNIRQLRPISIYERYGDLLGRERVMETRENRRRQQRIILTLIEDAIAMHELPGDVDADLAARCVCGIVALAHTFCRTGSARSAQELAERCAGFALAGITRAGIRDRPRMRLVTADE